MKVSAYKPDRLPIKNLDWSRFISLLGKARSALARYDEALKKAPPSLLERLKWEESISSLRGQNIEATYREVFQFSIHREAEETRFSSLMKIVNAKKGLDFAIHWARNKPLNIPFFCRLHGIVKGDAPNQKEIGRIREKQNWIGPLGKGMKEAYFFPPEPNKVKPLLISLLKYDRKNKTDPLIALAIFFAQFLIIHPFMDGNGRVVRIYVPVSLWKKGLICKPMLFLSAYFEADRLQYFQRLFYISEKKAWEDWILYFLQGVIDQSNRLKRKILTR